MLIILVTNFLAYPGYYKIHHISFNPITIRNYTPKDI